MVSIVIVGHVDHGKSTLIGRLMYDTHSIPKSKLDELKRASKRRGRDIEFAFFTDALEEEQEQNITIDTVQLYFKTKKRTYSIIDAPGHKEFLKNMVSGAASAETAILIIDAKEGVKEQTKRHAYILSLLGLTNIIVVINKMDKVGFKHEICKQIEENIRVFLDRLNIKPSVVIPISAKDGDNVCKMSSKMRWYTGQNIVDALENIAEHIEQNSPLRLPVQDVYKWDDTRRIVGRVESGKLSENDTVVFSPSLKRARVKSIDKWRVECDEAGEGECIGITLDEELFIERGEVISLKGDSPVVAEEFEANVFWLGKKPIEVGKKYILKLNSKEVECKITRIKKRIDSSKLEVLEKDAKCLNETEVGEVLITTNEVIALDKFNILPRTGRFVLVDGYDVCGGGIVVDHSNFMSGIE